MPGSNGFRGSEFRGSEFRDSRGEVESSGVSGRTALTVVIATMAVMIILYELINWRPG